jgi:hypothetical protein
VSVPGQADMKAEDADRLKRLASGSVDELSIGYEAVKATFEQDGERYIRRLKEVRLFEWSPVWVAMNPAALITGVKGASEAGGAETIDPAGHDALTAATTVVHDLTRWIEREQKVGRVLSASNMTKVDGGSPPCVTPSRRSRTC